MFCCEIPSLHLCLSVHRGNPFSFPNWLGSAFLMLPHFAGTAKWYQPKKAALLNPLQANYRRGKKVGRNLLLLFKCCTTLFCHMEHRRRQRHTSEPPFVLPLPCLLSEELFLCSLEQRGGDSWQASCQLLRSGGSHYFLLPHCSVVLG